MGMQELWVNSPNAVRGRPAKKHGRFRTGSGAIILAGDNRLFSVFEFLFFNVFNCFNMVLQKSRTFTAKAILGTFERMWRLLQSSDLRSLQR